jgi:tRNA-2-methylthio-N6-dimethylallyladenosine synthase
MNFSDSEIVASVLKKDDFALVDDAGQADLILLNTCSIRDKAEQRIWKRLEHLRALKKKNSALKIGIIGCMAERLKEELLSGENAVDLIAGPDAYRDLPQLVREMESGQKAANVQLSLEETYDDIQPVRYHSNGISAFVSIMRGCENFCTYCVVPFTRGKERSRSAQTILRECEELQQKGFKEVTLLGQNVNSYHQKDENGNQIGFAQLLQKVADAAPGMRIRFTTSHPKDLPDELLHVIANNKNICKAIHLAMQSGSSVVLERMNRKYSREFYLERIASARRIIPDVAVSTDIIAGFCGETEEDHKETLSAMRAAAFEYAFMFKYSKRPGTIAAKKFDDDVREEVKTRRLEEIIATQQELSMQSNRRDVGKTFEVLVEGVSKKSKTQLFGRNSQNKVVVFENKGYKAGDFVTVKVVDCTSATLIGERV